MDWISAKEQKNDLLTKFYILLNLIIILKNDLFYKIKKTNATKFKKDTLSVWKEARECKKRMKCV